MVYDPILNSQINVGDPITQSLMQKIKDNQDFFNGLIGGLDYYDVYNGSLDIDSDADDEPDGWTVALYPGGSVNLVSSTTPGHGANEFQATHPGGASNGGATLTSPYIAATALRQYFFGWAMDISSGATGIKIELEVEIYNNAKASLGSNVSLYSTTSNYTVTHRQYWAGWNPGVSINNLRFFKLKFILGNSDTDQAGTVGVSGISMATSMPQLFSADTFTFTARNTSSATWANLGSAISIDLPHDWYLVGNVPLFIMFPFEMAWNAAPSSGDRAEVRFQVGSDNSNVSYISYETAPNTSETIHGVAMIKTSPTGESFSIQPQAQVPSGSTAVAVRKDSGRTSIAAMTPGS